jgi:hypothetical protein
MPADIFMPPLGQRELPPPGTHIGALFSVVDLGTQELVFENRPRKQRQIRLSFELQDELTSAGFPHMIGKNLTLSSAPRAALRAFIESWDARALTSDGPPINLSARIGMTAVIGIKHRDGTNGMVAVLDTISRPPRGVPERLPLINKAVNFNLAAYDHDVFSELPSWLQDMVKKSAEWAKVVRGASLEDHSVDQRLNRMIGQGGTTGATPATAPAATTPTLGSVVEAKAGIASDLDDDIPFISRDVAFEPGVASKPITL